MRLVILKVGDVLANILNQHLQGLIPTYQRKVLHIHAMGGIFGVVFTVEVEELQRIQYFPQIQPHSTAVKDLLHSTTAHQMVHKHCFGLTAGAQAA